MNRFEETKAQTTVPDTGYRSYLSPEYKSPTNLDSKTVSIPESQDTKSKADKLISDILRKYQMERIPDASEANLKKSEHIIASMAGKESQVITSIKPIQVDSNSNKSPNVNFLSPLLSSAELGSKTNTLLYSNFLARDDIKTTDFLGGAGKGNAGEF